MYTENNSSYNDFHDSDLVINETPIGWSATCLDQTLFYYIDCNHIESNEEETKNLLFN